MTMSEDKNSGSNNSGSIGVIIVSHGKFGAAMLAAAESILGPQSDCVCISVDIAHDADDSVARLTDAVGRLDQGGGVIALTDMFGGTPTNLTLSLLKKFKAEVVTGINLPMLLKVFETRSALPLAELALEAGEAGKKGIVVAGNILRNKNRDRAEN